MLSVPWFVGWALRPYITIDTGTATSASSTAAEIKASSAAKSQVAQLSSPSAARPVSSTPSPTSPTSKSPYPINTQPISAKEDTQSRPQAAQAGLTKTTVSKTGAAVTPTSAASRSSQPVQAKTAQQVHEAEKQVSSKTVTLKMSTDWAQQQLQKFQFSFDEADRDKNGFLSSDEVFSVICKNGFKGSKDQAKELFLQLDVNNDQKVTRQEFSSALSKLPRITIREFGLRKSFQQLDKDGSGTLTRTEIENATKAEAGLDVPADKIAELLIVLSKDTKDDVVNYEEFLQVFGVQSTATVMQDIFSKLDTDKSGYLTKEEILQAVKAESELKLRAAKISDLLIAWHKDADKKINYQEFVQVWTKYK